jgi:hypothetical protein
MDKKAMIEIQFNWIYVAVIGAVILIIFTTIAMNIRSSARTDLEKDALSYFDEIFTGIQGKENTEHSIKLPDLDIEFIRTADECNYYKIAGSKINTQSIESIPVFSPDIVKKKVLSFSLGFDAPFRASYFLYLSSPEAGYFLVNKKDTKQLYDDLPSHLTKKIKDNSNEFKSENYYKARFISVSKSPAAFQIETSVAKIKDRDVTALNILPDDPAYVYGGGKFEFYTKKGNKLEKKGESTYINKASLFAGIYSESKEAYECNIEKAILRESKISPILAERAAKIGTTPLSEIQCTSSYYSQAKTILTSLETIAKDRKAESLATIDSLSKELEKLNTQLNSLSCPTIY